LVTTQHSNIQHYRTVTRLIDCATSFLDDLHIAVSEDARRSLPPWMRRRTQVLIHGIDRQRFRDSALPRDVARQSLDIPPDAYLIATVANLRAVKGYRTLLRAAARVAEWNSNVVFLAVGDGPERRGLEQDRDSLGLGQQFRFLGRRTDVATVLRSADLFVLASESEGLPVSLMEALTMGLPVVGSDVGGIPEIISQEVGVLVPPSQPDLLAAGLISLLSDPGRLERMQRAALQESERLEARLAVDLLIAGYSVALEQNPRRPGLRP
jgi:glycosyltransferase involved in cell wall biosynthesis